MGSSSTSVGYGEKVKPVDPPYVWELGADGVATITWRAGAVCTNAVARTTLVELSKLTSGRSAPILSDLRLLKSMTREARTVYGEATGAVSAVGLLAGSLTTQVIANFFISLNRPNVPTHMFTDEEKALAWLRRYVR